MLEARAINRYINTSPRKMRLVVDLIRGKSVPEALSILHFSTKHASRVAERVLRSAVSNLQNKDEGGRTEADTLFVKEVFVDVGPTLKRMLPAPMGRAYRKLKRSNHITIVVAQQNAGKAKKIQTKPAAAPAKTETKPAARKSSKTKAKE
jgi:large subunit ribosomal protein L22